MMIKQFGQRRMMNMLIQIKTDALLQRQM